MKTIQILHVYDIKAINNTFKSHLQIIFILAECDLSWTLKGESTICCFFYVKVCLHVLGDYYSKLLAASSGATKGSRDL